MNILQKRLINMAASIYELVKPFENDDILNPIVKQLIKSSTSVGANYSESQASSSYRDFFNKVKIAHKELKETQYWVLYFARIKKGQINTISIEAEIIELRRIFSSITKKADIKLNQQKKK